ncbi:aminotransferase class III-fold pyridoxal phosphate-dependent enzyme [Actinoallomurus soli]|uniref:aminotransferase class III-fold pyridoxal phosphate-dependent enzyme n=1 Tax=Actinoallomurus soli TaxID=2952535 RepID=UPI002092A374|nr:aminotransferase class III-fold pyridoxal phosphate-dependent enzyme [Actinoallomurus soli]MCO5970073.1 aminotransferase class III-fold pyridoxal phosphate-dependent enzyme [Actinoallomurus soli]
MRTARQDPGGADLLRRAKAVTAAETWDLNRRFPFVMDRASGAHIWDDRGNRYVDFTSCSGAAPLGAGYGPVVEHTISELRRTGGIVAGPLSTLRVEVAERLVDLFPCAERAIFFRTGSCATTAAVRLARVYSGKRRVLTSGYHGWHDWQLQYRPAMALPDRDPDTVDFGYDLERLTDLLAEDTAAVILTPEVNFFPPAYVAELEVRVKRHGALLILDEVMTGFRYARGGYHAATGVEPDLITVSKGLANGVALSAVLGRAAVMRADERTYLGNTYQREVTPFATAMATLDALADGDALGTIEHVGRRLIGALEEAFAAAGVQAWAFERPSMFDVVFADPELGHEFFQGLWNRGYLMQYGGRFMPSAATEDEDIEGFRTAAVEVLTEKAAERDGGGKAAFIDAAGRFGEEYFAATERAIRTWSRPPVPSA